MRVYLELNLDRAVVSPGVNQAVPFLRFKRNESASIEVQYSRSGVAVELDETADGIFAIKPVGKYDITPLTGCDGWNKMSLGADSYYIFTFTLINEALDALFFVDGDPANDIKEVTLMGEIEWTDLTGKHKTQKVPIKIDNNVIRTGDVIPGGGSAPDYLIDATDPMNPQFIIDDTSMEPVTAG